MQPLLYVINFDCKKKEDVFMTDGAICWKCGQDFVPENLLCGMFGNYIVLNWFFLSLFQS